MKRTTRYLFTCWVGAFALAAACHINGGQMSALTAVLSVGAVYFLGLAAQKMVTKKH